MNRSFILTALLALSVPCAFADNQGNNAELMSAQKAYRSAMTNYTQQKENVAELQAKADDLNKRIAGLKSELKATEEQLANAKTKQTEAEQTLKTTGERLDAAWAGRKK